MEDKENMDVRIEALKADLASYGTEVNNQFEALHSSLSACDRGLAIDLRSDPRNCIKSLRMDITHALDTIRDDAENGARFMEELEECDRMAAVLTDVTAASDAIFAATESINRADIMRTCQLLREMSERVQALPRRGSKLGGGRVCRLLRREAAVPSGHFEARLLRLLNSAIKVEPGRILISKSVQGTVAGEDAVIDDRIPLSELWAAFVDRGAADGAVSHVMEAIIRHVLRPLWRERKAAAPLLSSGPHRAELIFDSTSAMAAAAAMTSSAGGGTTGLLQGGKVGGTTDGRVSDNTFMTTASAPATAPRLGELGACRLSYPVFLERVLQVLTFTWTQALCEDERLGIKAASVLNEASGPVGFLDALGSVLRELLPRAEADLAAFQRLVLLPCREVEARLSGLGSFGEKLLCAGGVSPLAENVHALYTEARRRAVLSQARELVLADYHNAMIACGDARVDDTASAGSVGDGDGDGRTLRHQDIQACTGNALGFEECHISITACRLLKLVHATLEECCSAKDTTLAQVLYQTTRDCLELFLAIVPVRYADVVQMDVRMGAIFYNDCMYVAHNTTLLTRAAVDQLRHSRHTALRACIAFVDFIPRFRAMGEACLASHVERQQAVLEDIFSEIHLSATGGPCAGATGDVEAGSHDPSHSGDGAMGSDSADDTDGGGSGGLNDSLSDRLNTSGFLVGALVERLGFARRDMDLGRSTDGSAEGYNDDIKAVALVKHMKGLRDKWSGTLQESVYDRLVGHLIGHILSMGIEHVMSAKIISEGACADIIRIFRALQGCKALLLQQTDSAVLRSVPHWRKFAALTDVLGYSVTDIAEWLPRRKFADFSASELTGLVRALFDESPRRAKLLAGIDDLGARTGA